MEPETSAVLVKVGITVLERTAASGLNLAKTALLGKSILVLGPSESGKTTFSDYLRHDIFQPEKFVDSTIRARKERMFVLKLNRKSDLRVNIKSMTEIPGQHGSNEHARCALEYNPHGLVIMLDASAPMSSKNNGGSIVPWFETFCKRLENEWRKAKTKKNRIQTIVVLVNKRDKATRDKIDKVLRKVRTIAETELKEARGNMNMGVAVFETCMVHNGEGASLADIAITHLLMKLNGQE